MNIWLITVGEPLPIGSQSARLWRTGLLAEELVRRQHTVTWWTSTVDHFTKTYHLVGSQRIQCGEQLSIQFLQGPLYTRNISLARWRNHIAISDEFAALAKSRQVPDIIVCSFPTIELSARAVAYGALKNVPVILDIRDLWPDELVLRIPASLRWLAPIVLRSLYRQTREALRGAAAIVAISRRYMEWGLAIADREMRTADSIITHGYPDPKRAHGDSGSATTHQWSRKVDPTKKIFWFVGTFVGSIDLTTVIEAARTLQERADIQFVFTGSGERDSEWRALASDLGNVVFTGWADGDGIAKLAAVAYAGLASYKAGALMSLTNKLFEYLGYGLPLLISLPGEATDLVKSASAGLAYVPGSAPDLRSKVIALADSRALRDSMSCNARALFEQKYSAEMVYASYAACIERVAVGSRSL
jgi:glycosyltransferase involved in cell wall biosynthesis